MDITVTLPSTLAVIMLYIVSVCGEYRERYYTVVDNPTIGNPPENGNVNIDSAESMFDCARKCTSPPTCWWWVTYNYSFVTQTHSCMTSSLPLSMAVAPPGGQMLTGEYKTHKVQGIVHTF